MKIDLCKKEKKVKEIPILFSWPMILKTIADEKTVTRRIVQPQPPDNIEYFDFFEAGFACYYIKVPRRFRAYICGEPCGYPYIKAKYGPGDRLWVRETWGIAAYSNESYYEIGVMFKADKGEKFGIDLDNEELWERYIAQEREYIYKNCGYGGPICIDAKAGCPECKHFKGKDPMLWRPSIFLPRVAARVFLNVKTVRIERLHELDDTEARLEGFKDREDFTAYWNTLNQKRGFPWAANPWVYRIEYDRVKDDS
jgi:hypothetical protein